VNGDNQPRCRVNRKHTAMLAVTIDLLKRGLTPFVNSRVSSLILALDPVTGETFGIGIQRGGAPTNRLAGEAVRAVVGRDPQAQDNRVRLPAICWHAWDEAAPRFWERTPGTASGIPATHSTTTRTEGTP
jgi:hypothetical protein